MRLKCVSVWEWPGRREMCKRWWINMTVSMGFIWLLVVLSYALVPQVSPGFNNVDDMSAPNELDRPSKFTLFPTFAFTRPLVRWEKNNKTKIIIIKGIRENSTYHNVIKCAQPLERTLMKWETFHIQLDTMKHTFIHVNEINIISKLSKGSNLT